jgi:dolichyl-phosphate beta-glucosyltransferase
MKSLSLVIPAYGAGDLLHGILSHVPSLKGVAEGCGFGLVEVIVVDDGGEPAVDTCGLPPTGEVPVKVLRNGRNMGKGFSVKRGALAAKGDWVLMSDVEASAPLSEFAALAPFADRAIVCGSRRCGRDVRPLHRRILSWVFNALTGTGLRDTQCGFKLFNMALMRPVFEGQRTERFAFDVELIRKAPSVAEVPVVWRGGKRSSLKVWRDAPRMLWDLVRIRCS